MTKKLSAGNQDMLLRLRDILLYLRPAESTVLTVGEALHGMDYTETRAAAGTLRIGSADPLFRAINATERAIEALEAATAGAMRSAA